MKSQLRLSRAGLRALAGFWAVTTAFLWVSGFPRWRTGVVAACWAVQAMVTLRFQRRAPAPVLDAFPRGGLRLAAVYLGTIAVAVAVTGGLLSPMLVVLLTTSMTALAIFGGARECRILVGATGAILVLLGFLPHGWTGPALGRGTGGVIAGASLLVSILTVGLNVLEVRRTLRACARELSRVQEELAAHALARAQGLEQVAAQLAHELKNPVAAVKALAQLGAAGDAPSAAGAAFARIAREVARMQARLAEHLSFARPRQELRNRPEAPPVRVRVPRVSLALTASFQVFAVAAVALGGLSPARIAGVAAICLVKLVATARYVFRPGPPLPPDAYPPGALVVYLVHVVGGAGWLAITGGLQSPFLVMNLPPPVLSVALFEAAWQTRLLVAVTALGVLIPGLLPARVTGPPLSGPAGELLVAVGAFAGMLMVGVNLVAGRRALAASARALAQARDELAAFAVARAQSLEEMGARLARELEGPLAVVGEVAQDCARVDDARAREWLAVIGREVDRMQDILAEYRTLARPLQTFQPELVSLGPLVADVLGVLSGHAARAGVQEGYQGDASVTADPRRLKEALLNLVSNAIDATPAGGRVEVDVASGDGQARIVIRDTGRGMPPEVLERVGTPFFTTRATGTGLGVVLARSVFHRHGGALRYESAPGLGTTVTATLPFDLADRGFHGQRAVGG